MVIRDIATLAEAQTLRLKLKQEGYTRVGISGQADPKDGSYTGLFVVEATGLKVKGGQG